MAEVCKDCGQVHGKRIDLNTICEKDDLDSLDLIRNKINCATQAVRPDAIPDGVSKEKAKLFIQSAIDSLGAYRWLENDWWKDIVKKYKLPQDKNVRIDFGTGMFYILENEE